MSNARSPRSACSTTVGISMTVPFVCARMATSRLPMTLHRSRTIGNHKVANHHGQGGDPDVRPAPERGPRGNDRRTARGCLGVHGRPGRPVCLVRRRRMARPGGRWRRPVPVRRRLDPPGHRVGGRPQPPPDLALARTTRRRVRARARRADARHDRAQPRAGGDPRAHHRVAAGPGAGSRVTQRDPDPVFEALADPTRRAVIEAPAADGPTTLSDLTRRMPVTRQAVAKHLAVLQDAGLVEGTGPVRGRMYSFTPQPLTDAMTWIVDVGAGWDERLARLKRHVERRA